MTDPRPLASVSLDADNLWSYMKTHGDPGWETRPSYLGVFFPPVLDALDELRLRITFFCVGVDADREENLAAFQSLTVRGHEIGNHSYEHEPWLHRYSAGQGTASSSCQKNGCFLEGKKRGDEGLKPVRTAPGPIRGVPPGCSFHVHRVQPETDLGIQCLP